MRQFDAGHVAEQNAMRMQRALRRPGGAGGVDHHRRIVGGCILGREGIRSRLQKRGKAGRAIRLAVGRDHQFQIGRSLAETCELLHAHGIGDQDLRAGILQPVGQRFGAEQQRERQRNRAKLVDRDMRDHRFRRLRQQDRHPVAATDTVRPQRVGKLVRQLHEGAKRHRLDTAVAVDMDNGRAMRVAYRPAIADIDTDIVTSGDLPAKLAIEPVVVLDQWKHPAALQAGRQWSGFDLRTPPSRGVKRASKSRAPPESSKLLVVRS